MLSASTGAAAEPGLLLLATCYGLVIAGLTAYAAYISLSRTDAAHRADAYKVLKLIWGTATGSAGFIALTLHLSNMVLM